MKKLSVVGVLAMLVTVSLYSVSGTYAKYTSKIDFTDEARVAKWELLLDGNKVTTTQNINLFKDSYSVDGKGVYVQSIDNAKVVAPGTTGFYDLKLSGDMEVRYQLEVLVDAAANDFVVYYDLDNDGKVTNMSKTKNGQAYEYHPIRYTIEKLNSDGTTTPTTIPVNGLTFAQLKAALAKYNSSNSYAPGAFTKNYRISWAWDAVNANDGSATATASSNTLSADNANALDTFAGENLSADADKINFAVTVVATQVAEDYAK